MAKTSNFVKTKYKFDVQRTNFCFRCGRPRSFMRKFGICRLCFRELAHKGQLPGVKKSSW